MTWTEEHAILMRAIALRRGGKMAPLWANGGRYLVGGWDQDKRHYTAEGLRMLVENEGVEPPRSSIVPSGQWVRSRPIQRAARPQPRYTRGRTFTDAELVALITGRRPDRLDRIRDPWELRRAKYLARKTEAINVNRNDSCA